MIIINKNIEVINKNLWAVNFDYVKMGFIKELTFDKINPSDYASITRDGKIVLNNSKTINKDIVRYLLFIMKLPNNKLLNNCGLYNFLKLNNTSIKRYSDKDMDDYIVKMQLAKVKQFFNNLCEIEKQRRNVQQIYIKGTKKSLKIRQQKGV